MPWVLQAPCLGTPEEHRQAWAKRGQQGLHTAQERLPCPPGTRTAEAMCQLAAQDPHETPQQAHT